MTKVCGSREVLNNAFLNKGTSFTSLEQKELGIEGLVPEVSESLALQVERVLYQLHDKKTPFDCYLYLMELLEINETLFYKVVMSDPVRFLPLIYTPTIGEACKHYDKMMRKPRGMYIFPSQRGNMRNVLSNWPHDDVRFICVTNGGRVLGLGDLGANSMPIPIGKLQLYTVAAGVHPRYLMPVYLDCGTNNPECLASPFYLGKKQHRMTGEALYEFVDEFIEAAVSLFPHVCIHFEDWGGSEAVQLLERYKERVCCFNDDIQGTAAVVLAGVLNGARLMNKKLSEQKFLFFGAGSAAVGIADLLVANMVQEGMSVVEARKKMMFFNTGGIVSTQRKDVKFFQKPYVQDVPHATDLVATIHSFQPTTLIGVSTVGGAFTQPVIEAMSQVNQHPMVFALSNPMTHAECTAEQAYQWTQGRGIFAAGVQFPPVTYEGRTFIPGQANNLYAFPALGLAVLATKAQRIPDEVFVYAAHAIAQQVSEEQLNRGTLYPSQANILESELQTAIAIAQCIFNLGLASVPYPEESMEAFLRSHLYKPCFCCA